MYVLGLPGLLISKQGGGARVSVCIITYLGTQCTPVCDDVPVNSVPAAGCCDLKAL